MTRAEVEAVLRGRELTRDAVEPHARRALRARLKTRFFHRWNRPGYQTRAAFHEHCEAYLDGVCRAIDEAVDAGESDTIEQWRLRGARNNIGLLLEEVDDCLKYIAHLEHELDSLVPKQQGSTSRQEGV